MITAVGELDSEHQTSPPSSPVFPSTYRLQKSPLLSQLQIGGGEDMPAHEQLLSTFHNAGVHHHPVSAVAVRCVI